MESKNNPMPLYNYHMHTARCGHARGTDREYVEEAIRRGFRTVGFSDHTPQPFPNGFYDVGIRMRCEELEGYVRSVLDLKAEYKKDINILLGLEVEYFPQLHEAWARMVEPYPFEFFLLAIHFFDNEYDSVSTAKPTNDPKMLTKYVDQAIEGMRLGKFLYLAHPDLLHYTDSKSDFYRAEMTRLCEEAKRLHLPLELNLLGLREKRWYPIGDFWEVAGKVGNDVILGSDAHSPDVLYHAAALDEAYGMIERYGLHRIEKLI